jgi:hypothetical protein
VHDNSADSVSSDIISYVSWQKHMTDAKKFDEDATRRQLMFWQELATASPDLNRLQDLSIHINTAIAGGHAAFAALLNLQPHSVEVMRMNASFLADVTNDQALSNTLLKKADDLEEKQSQQRYQQSQNQKVDEDRNALITVSGSKHKCDTACNK